MEHYRLIEKSSEIAWKAVEEGTERQDYSMASLELLHKSLEIIKLGKEIEMLEEYSENDESYEGGNSGAGRRGTYVGGYYRRERGSSRESGGSYGGESYGGGSYESGESYEGGSYRGSGGNSGHRGGRKERMMNMVHEMMDMAEDEKQREAVRHFKEQLDRD